MINLPNILRGLRNPSHFAVFLRRLFPWRALWRDPECAHMIKSWSSGKLPRRSLNDLFPGIDAVDVVVKVPYKRVVGTATDIGEVVCLSSVLKYKDARRVLEIGTNDGFNALNLAANLEAPDSVVCTVDLPVDDSSRGQITNACDPSIVGIQFRNQKEAARIRQVYGDSTQIDWKTLGGPFDLIFIDGCHDRAFVEKDSRRALENLARGGVIFWHDYGIMPDVSNAVDGLDMPAGIAAVRGTRLAVYCDQHSHDRPSRHV
jgi:predicted O-methyltransferase YrrM